MTELSMTDLGISRAASRCSTCLLNSCDLRERYSLSFSSIFAWPGAVAGTLLAFVIALGEYVASVLVFVPSNQPISIRIAGEMRDFNLGTAAAYGVILICIITIAMLIAARLERGREIRG